MSFRPYCFALRCTGKRDPHALMCQAHWGMVPRDVRARLARYVRVPVRVGTASRAYCEAAADAIEGVAKVEGYPSTNIWRARARELARREQVAAAPALGTEGEDPCPE
jgi:hypothetical protein